MAVLVEYDDDIRLKHIRLGQIDIEWSMVKYSEWVICQIAQKNEFEITGNILKPGSGFRKVSIVLDRQSRGIRSDDHPRKSIRCKSRTQLRLGTAQISIDAQHHHGRLLSPNFDPSKQVFYASAMSAFVSLLIVVAFVLGARWNRWRG